MGIVSLKDFEILACHGVNEEEKRVPQRFVVSVDMEVDIAAAAREDDLDKTVSYSAVKKLADKFVKDNCFDLIETLADRLAMLILRTFGLARSVTVTVKKPDAPMSGKFDFVSVTSTRRWHRVYLSLGSNEGDRNAYLDLAVNELKMDEGFGKVKESSRMASAPYGGVAKGQFVNSAVEADTLYEPYELLDVLHEIERKGGRVREERWGDRTLDIDILFFDDLVVDSPELAIPHADMLNRDFVLLPLAELNPNKMHPLTGKRIGELAKGFEKA